MTIYTAHWAAKLPPGHTRVSISRGSPRWQKPESFKHYKFWKPGPWYKTASPQEYLDLFNAILAKLNPGAVYDDLEALGPNPTVLCWEKPKDIQEGNCYCHRHICAQWLEDTLGIKVEEVGHPNLPRFRYLNEEHVAAPSYARRERVDLFP